MAESDTLDHLVDVEAKAFWVNSNRVFFKHFQQVLLNILEDKIEAALPKHKINIWLETNRLNASFNVTIFLYFKVLSIRTSRMIVFLAISSSSDSLNFLIATINIYGD